MPIILDFEQAIFRWQARHGEKMTYAELAKRAGISKSTVYRLTSGQPTHLDLDKLNRICKVLECQPGDLLPRTDTTSKIGSGTSWHGGQYSETAEFLRQYTDHTEQGQAGESNDKA
jgi:DNA-binding Xre family transcriptional regulator